jgi:hypothetical protein
VAAPRSRTVAEGWIREAGLRAFRESLAAAVAYHFDDSDWPAIDTALPTPTTSNHTRSGTPTRVLLDVMARYAVTPE